MAASILRQAAVKLSDLHPGFRRSAFTFYNLLNTIRSRLSIIAENRNPETWPFVTKYTVGIPSSYGQGSGADIDARAWEIYGYAQDNWKVSSSVTFNYGIGYDIQTPNSNLQYGDEGIICFAPGAQSKIFPTAQEGLLYPGDPGCNNQDGATAKYDHLAPRIGFDWSPSSQIGWLTGPAGEHKLAIRAGFGLYFNRDSEEEQLQNLEDPPFGISSLGAKDVGGSPSFANPFTDIAGRAGKSEANRFPYTFPTAGQTIDFSPFPPYELSGVDPTYDVPYVYNFNLNIERQLPGNQVLTVGYVGSLGRRLARAYEADKETLAGHADVVNTCNTMTAAAGGDETDCLNFAQTLSLNAPQDFRDTSGNFLSVGHVYTDGTSNYNSLQVSLNKQANHGLYYIVSYTYAHALDNGSSFESSGFGNGNDIAGTNWVPGFNQLSYGNSEYDARHTFRAG
jgi:hypothetical protein